MESVHLFQKDGIIETTWDEIKRNPGMISTGDYIPFELQNGEEVAVRAAHNSKGKLFFILEDCLGTTHCVNSANNAGAAWKTCEMRKWLNESVFALLPNDLQKAVVQTEITEEDSRGNKITSKNKLFLLSLNEVFGIEPTSGQKAAQDQLDWFKSEPHRIKRFNGEPSWWWLRSNYSRNYFYTVYGSGKYNGEFTSSFGGVVFGFCLTE